MKKNKLNKLGQMHMTETVAVLFIFFILIFFGMIFYYKYSQAAFLQDREEMLGKRAVETTIKTLFMPELGCSRGEAVAEDNCFDLMKVRQASSVLETHSSEYYYEIFAYANITLFQVYPEEYKTVIYEHPKPNATRIEPTYFVVSLKDEALMQDKPFYGFGYIKVEVYS